MPLRHEKIFPPPPSESEKNQPSILAKIIPIYEKDDEMQLNKYMPIYLLPTISNKFEKIIFQKLYKYFIKYNLFYNRQYGFREGHSTEFATLELVDKLTLEKDNMNSPINIFLDMSKAFDMLNHTDMLK